MNDESHALSAGLFPCSAAIDSAAPEQNRADWLAIPAKGAVYLLIGSDPEQGRGGGGGGEAPLLLATVGDLRSALKRRLADTPPETKSRRVEYGRISTRILWRRVDSAFAANWWYWNAARQLFPAEYRGMIAWRNAWWIAVERGSTGATPFPRFRKTSQLSDPGLAFSGPVRDKHAAQRLIESLEDLFDLCRYHEILVRAPQGKACTYKEMGKCPAPCDGSVSLAHYRGQIDAALAFAGNQNRSGWRSDVEQQMKTAAVNLEFEKAARLKQRLTRAGVMENEALAFLAPLENFAFLTLQPGKGRTWFEPWIFCNGRSECLPQASFKELPGPEGIASRLAARAREILAASPPPAAQSYDDRGTEEAAIVAHHLFKADRDAGVWLRLAEAQNPEAILAAAEQLRLRRQPRPIAEQASDGEMPIESPAAPTEPAA